MERLHRAALAYGAAAAAYSKEFNVWRTAFPEDATGESDSWNAFVRDACLHVVEAEIELKDAARESFDGASDRMALPREATS